MNFWAFVVLVSAATAQIFAGQTTFSGAGFPAASAPRAVSTTTTLKTKGGKHKKKGTKRKSGKKTRGATSTIRYSSGPFMG